MNDFCKIKNMQRNIRAFTFVELIVVITIMAILATIGFMVYKDYLVSSYDSNRIAQLSDIHDGLELMSVSSKLPYPDNMIELTASGTTFAYQGDAGDIVIKTIGYDGGWKDPEFWTPFVYMLSKWGKDFQLMTFVKDAWLVSNAQSYADTGNYIDYFPITQWAKLWILLERETQTPFYRVERVSSYDIMSWTGNLVAYLSSNERLDAQKDMLFSLLPRSSCKRILDLWNSQGSGIYILDHPGGKKVQVYCDMETDGWGWTKIARAVKGFHNLPFWWLVSQGDVKNEAYPYSLWAQVRYIRFTDLLVHAELWFQGARWDYREEVKWKAEWLGSMHVYNVNQNVIPFRSKIEVLESETYDNLGGSFGDWWQIHLTDRYVTFYNNHAVFSQGNSGRNNEAYRSGSFYEMYVR